MLRKKHHPLLFFANLFIFAAVIIFDTTEIADISIKTATPMLLLPLLCGYAFFADVKRCVIAGLVAGAFVDSIGNSTYCFNTVILMLLAVAVCLASNNLFNKNIRAAVVLTLITAAVYYIFLWLFFYLYRTDMQSSLGYLLKYALPSAVYSTFFVLPFYYIYRRFKELKNIS